MRVLLTGAFGNVGRYTVQRLLEEGHVVIASDVRTPASEKAAADLASPGLSVLWTDLRDPAAVLDLVVMAKPDAVVHLAAVIPPIIYRNPSLGRAVNVDGTANLVTAVLEAAPQARFVLASSIGVYGSRSPHLDELLTADTPPDPRDSYGSQKLAAEEIVRGSALAWAVLRLGAVLFPEVAFSAEPDTIYLEGLLPSDGRVETVDARDVAAAFASAIHAPCVGKVLLIGGGETSRLTQEELTRGLTGAMGLAGSVPRGRPGDPADPQNWFVTDWMDTTEAQALLGFQEHAFADTMADLAKAVGFKRFLAWIVVPFAWLFLWWRSPMRGSSATYAPLWSKVVEHWGDDAVVTRA